MNFVKKVLSFVLSPIHMLVYGLALVIFHLFMWISFNVFGQKALKKVTDILNIILIKSLWIVGIRTKFQNPYNIPTDRPIIIVANHQSHYDISPLTWFFRKHSIKYLAKIELDSSIPSIGYNLRHGGSIFIDPSNPRQTLMEIRKFGKYLDENNYAGVIFPEGQRNYDGKPSVFFQNGLKMLLKFTPRALVVPVTINNSWKILENGYFQLPLGLKTSWTAHQPLEPKDMSFEELSDKVEKVIIDNIMIE